MTQDELNKQLSDQLRKLQAATRNLLATHSMFKKCLGRIAKAHGFSEPIELMALAKENENFAEVLARQVEDAAVNVVKIETWGDFVRTTGSPFSSAVARSI